MRKIAENLWIREQPQRVLGLLEEGTRMTVVRLADGGLFLHSAVHLDRETRSSLDRLGPVCHVVAPNLLHHLYVAEYREAYPEAHFHAAPGLAEKRGDFDFDSVLGDEAPEEWSGELDQRFIQGVPTLNEVAFFHRETRTLLLTDLCFNFVDCEHRPTRIFLRLMGGLGHFACPRHVRWSFRDRRAARASLDQVLRWDIERIIVAHGVVLQRGGTNSLRESFDWV